MQYYTGSRIEKRYYINKYWEKGKKPIKNTAPEAERINLDLKTLRLHVESLHSNLKALGKTPTVSYFKQRLDGLYKGKTTSGTGLTMFQVSKLYLEEGQREKARNSFPYNRTPLNHFVAFFEKRHSKKVDIKSIEYDESFL